MKKKIKQLLESARAFNQNNEWHKCIDALPDVELEALKSADLYAEKAEAYYLLNQLDKSRIASEQALFIDSHHAKANNYLGNWFSDQSNPDKAIEHYQKAIKNDQGYVKPYNGLGNEYSDKKAYEKAIEWYQKALQIDPSYAPPYNGLGNVYSDKKEYEKAIEWYQKALQIDPEDAYPFVGIGNVYSDKKAYEKAIEWYQKALQIDPTFAYSYNGLGNVYRNKKEYEKAIEWYQKTIQIDPSFALPYHGLGNVYSDKKEYEKAIEWYQKAIQIGPSYARPYNGLGNVYRNKKEYEKAIEWYQKAIQIDPSYVLPYHGLGNVYSDQAESKTAIEWYQKAIQIDPSYALPYNGLGNAYSIKNEYEKAIEFYQKSLQIDPSFAHPYNGLGILYYYNHEYEKAVESYQKAIQIDPDFDYPYYNLGLTLKLIGKHEAAKSEFEKYLEITTDKDDYGAKQAKALNDELEKLINYSTYFDNISKLINDVKSLLRIQGGCITHYTSLSVARYLILAGSKFRLSEGAFLNDTSEGRELFRYLNFHINSPNDHETVAEPFTKKPFIGSFVDEKKHDDLTMWRMYGKENKEDAKGCSITLDMKLLLELLKEELQGKSSDSGNRESIAPMNKEFIFYQVAYHEKENKKFVLPGAKSQINKRLNKLMLDLAEAVKQFNAYIPENIYEQRDAAVLINEIAYLFKTAEYQHEHEIRLVIEDTGFNVKFNESEELPKAYIEIADIRKAITKITLGPKIERAAEWAAVFYYRLMQENLRPEIFISHLPFK